MEFDAKDKETEYIARAGASMKKISCLICVGACPRPRARTVLRALVSAPGADACSERRA